MYRPRPGVKKPVVIVGAGRPVRTNPPIDTGSDDRNDPTITPPRLLSIDQVTGGSHDEYGRVHSLIREGVVMDVSENPTLVGRGPHCGLVIDDASVSSSHAEVVRRGGSVFVKDLNSTNGTTVNGQTVNGEAEIPAGGRVTFGTAAFVLQGSTLVEAPPEVGRTQIVGGGSGKSPTGTAQVPSTPPPPPPAADSSLADGAGRWTAGLLSGYVPLLAGLGVSVVLAYVFYESDSTSSYDNWETWNSVYAVLYSISQVLTIPIAIMLIVWTYKAHKASDALQPGPRRWGRGWSIGAWFIPIANFILVPLVLAEIHKIASTERSGGKAVGDWPRRSTPAGLKLWFVFFALGGWVLFIGASLANGLFARAGLFLTLVALGLTGTAAALAAAFIRDVSDKLR